MFYKVWFYLTGLLYRLEQRIYKRNYQRTIGYPFIDTPQSVPTCWPLEKYRLRLAHRKPHLQEYIWCDRKHVRTRKEE